MKTTWLIGCMCKGGDTFSLAVLIDRGLDHRQAHLDTIIFDMRCMLIAKGEFLVRFYPFLLLLCSVLRVQESLSEIRQAFFVSFLIHFVFDFCFFSCLFFFLHCLCFFMLRKRPYDSMERRVNTVAGTPQRL